MNTEKSQGAILFHRYLHSMFAIGLLSLMVGCNKNKEAPAVIEEVPASATAETDTSAMLSEEPDLQQVGKDAKAGSVKNTFNPSSSASSAGFSDGGRYVVQVGVFKSKRQAAGLVEKLANSGYPAYVAQVENPVPELSGTYHRVRIGRFARIPDAKAFGENTLKPMGYDFWVDNKKNDAVGGDGSGYSAPAPSSEPVTPASETWTPAPSEPSTPASETWGTPPAAEPATPAADPYSTPSTETPSSTPSTPYTPSTPEPSEPAPPVSDTGKVNLDEW